MPLKLLAFEHLLHAVSLERARKLRLLLIGLIPDARPDDHARCKAEVVSLVTRINHAFPGAVVFTECKNGLDIRSRLAYFAITDVLVVTAVREGLNLLPIEYMLARESHPGVIVLSEFCSPRDPGGSITCNPWSVRKVSAATRRCNCQRTREPHARHRTSNGA